MVIFDQTNPKRIEPTFSFFEFVPAWKNDFNSIYLFLSPVTWLATPIFDHVHPKEFWPVFDFCDLVSTCKKSLTILFLTKKLLTHWPYPFLTMLSPKNFQLPFVWNCTSIKKKSVPSVLSWDTVNFIVQRPHWPHSFLAMPHQKLFNQL